MDRTAAFRAQLAGTKCHAGNLIKDTLGRVGKAGMGNVELNVRAGQTIA